MSSLKNNIAKFLYLPGDGIGLEMGTRAIPFLTEMVECFNKKTGNDLKIHATISALGTSALIEYGAQIPEKTRELIESHIWIVKGPTRTPYLDNHEEMKAVWLKCFPTLMYSEAVKEIAKLTSANVALRKMYNLYVCKRPVYHLPNVPTPFTKTDLVNWTIYRENTEGYYGMPNLTVEQSKALVAYLEANPEFEAIAKQIKREGDFITGFGVCSEIATKRLMRAALKDAIKTGKKIVTIVHKANIIKGLDGAFLQWCKEVIQEKEFADLVVISKDKTWRQFAYSQSKIIVDSIIVDNSLEKGLTRPENYDILVMENFKGDFFSDFAAGLIGGLGVSPGANIKYEINNGILTVVKAVYEATHGTGDDITGQNKVNPVSLLLSFCMMFEDMEGLWSEFGDFIKDIITEAYKRKEFTGDLARQLPDNHPSLSFTEFMDILLSIAKE